MRNAIDTYNMIEENDRIAVGVSGGKDSLVLLYGLSLLKKYYPKKFNIVAVTLDPCFENKDSDFSAIEDFCKKLDVEYHIKRTELYNVVFENRQEKNPCSLCARMRRGILHDMSKAHGCNKIALGHHKDDAAETVLMNLFQGGTIGCFTPVTYLSNKDIISSLDKVFKLDVLTPGISTFFVYIKKLLSPLLRSKEFLFIHCA
jgi:tRNA(Ile)-lysidine synthase TilS/MesJ